MQQQNDLILKGQAHKLSNNPLQAPAAQPLIERVGQNTRRKDLSATKVFLDCLYDYDRD
jgi:hypothetical protein